MPSLNQSQKNTVIIVIIVIIIIVIIIIVIIIIVIIVIIIVIIIIVVVVIVAISTICITKCLQDIIVANKFKNIHTQTSKQADQQKQTTNVLLEFIQSTLILMLALIPCSSGFYFRSISIIFWFYFKFIWVYFEFISQLMFFKCLPIPKVCFTPINQLLDYLLNIIRWLLNIYSNLIQ